MALAFYDVPLVQRAWRAERLPPPGVSLVSGRKFDSTTEIARQIGHNAL